MKREAVVREALVRAIRFLQRAQHPDGLWSDYQLVSGKGTTWVTAYVGYCLEEAQKQVNTEHGLHSTLAGACRALITHPAHPAGWGYNPQLLADSDSTAWAVRFLKRVQVEESDSLEQLLRSAWALLQGNQNKDGGIATYGERVLQQMVPRVESKTGIDSFVGWKASHLSVTAATLEAGSAWSFPEDGPDFRKAACYLAAGQQSDGLWYDYWWVGPYYVTYLALQSLHNLANWDPGGVTYARGHAAFHALTALQQPDGAWGCETNGPSDPFATALAVASMLLQDDGDLGTILRGLDWLLQAQRPDGSFSPSALMRLPPPFMAPKNPGDPAQPGSLHLDEEGNFTTATVAQAFARYLGSRESIR